MAASWSLLWQSPVFTGVLFSLVPILKSSHPDINEALRAGGRGSSEQSQSAILARLAGSC